MKKRALVVVVAVAAAVLLDPAGVRADKFKPPYTDVFAGFLHEDSTCPAATHSLTSLCVGIKRCYLVLDRVKGLKNHLGNYVVVSGPVDTTSCPLPLVHLQQSGRINFRKTPPPPCDGGPPLQFGD